MAKFIMVFRGGGYANPGSLSPTEVQQHLAKWNAWTDGLLKAGRMTAGYPLEYPAGGKTIRGKDKVTTDGPYAESKESRSRPAQWWP